MLVGRGPGEVQATGPEREERGGPGAGRGSSFSSQ